MSLSPLSGIFLFVQKRAKNNQTCLLLCFTPLPERSRFQRFVKSQCWAWDFYRWIGCPLLIPYGTPNGDSPMILIQKLFDCVTVNPRISACSSGLSTVSMMPFWSNRYFRFHWLYYIRFLNIFQGVLYWANSKFSVNLFMQVVHYFMVQYTGCQKFFVFLYTKRTLCHEINEKQLYFWRVFWIAWTA